MNAPPATIALSLVSHTNVGKTTLARTLLLRDIGEVRDEAHVTQAAEAHSMLQSPAGDQLLLWDTPGFGDSVRLARRLAQAGNPLGWFLSEVWDRFRDRAFWASQRAVRNVLDQADVVLYLVNAAEAPEDAGYLAAELQVLALVGKPVVVLLNQLGPPRAAPAEAAELQRWRDHLARLGGAREVLAFDAFARCWVQEQRLLAAVAAQLAPAQHPAFERLQAAWRARGHAAWTEAMAVLAGRVTRAAFDREPVLDAGWSERLRQVGTALGLRRDAAPSARERAMQALAARLEADVRETTDRLIRLHGLDGHAADAVLARLAEHYALREPVSEGRAAVLGGLLTGALAGLKADIATGGLTLGGGLLAGGVLGALGAAGLARGYNLVRGVETPTLAWTDAVLGDAVHAALLGYLAVAHYGRGRGDWTAAEQPAFWHDAASAALAERAAAFAALWATRDDAGEDARRAFAARLQALLTEACRALLLRLYPDAGAALGPAP